MGAGEPLRPRMLCFSIRPAFVSSAIGIAAHASPAPMTRSPPVERHHPRGEPVALKGARRVRRAVRETEQRQRCHRAPGRPNTLYFETDQGDGFREPGFSKERRLEPQITVGLLTDARGFPLMVHAFEGNEAETKTILPVVQAFIAAHQLPEVTVVADDGMCRRPT
jgi:hypothetical protein